MEDEQGKKLKAAWLQAEYAYLSHMFPVWDKQFPPNMRYDDSFLWEREDLGLDESPKEERRLRRRLMLRVHPDKCPEPDAKQLFVFVQSASFEILQELAASDNLVQAVRSRMEHMDIEDRIRHLKSTYAYLWTHGHQSMFIDEEAYARKLQASIARRTAENLRLKHQMDTLQKSLDGMQGKKEEEKEVK